MADEIVLRWSRWERIAYIAFFAVWLAFVLLAFRSGLTGSDNVFLVLLLAFGAASFVRMLGCRCRPAGTS